MIKAKKSRNHTELLYKHLKLPIKIKRDKKYDFITINGIKKIKKLNYKIPSDISSSSFFIVLTILSEKSELIIKNVNINPSRIGILKILKLMNIKIFIKNKKNYKGEMIADLHVKSQKNITPINCPTKFNSQSIDEFLLIFLVAAKANGISYFKNLSELNEKESPRLVWGSKILRALGVKILLKIMVLKFMEILSLKFQNITIKNYLKDHRVFMTSVVAALCFLAIGKYMIKTP